MNIKNANNLCYLDEIRHKNGADKLKTIFYEMAEKNREKAVNLINDKRLLFCSLFILLPEIEALNLYASLNSRNIIAIKMCAKILKDIVLARRIDHLSSQGDELIPTVLQWILKTGAKNVGKTFNLTETKTQIKIDLSQPNFDAVTYTINVIKAQYGVIDDGIYIYNGSVTNLLDYFIE